MAVRTQRAPTVALEDESARKRVDFLWNLSLVAVKEHAKHPALHRNCLFVVIVLPYNLTNLLQKGLNPHLF